MYSKATTLRFNFIITFILLISSFILSINNAAALSDTKNIVVGKPVKNDNDRRRSTSLDSTIKRTKVIIPSGSTNRVIKKPSVIVPMISRPKGIISDRPSSPFIRTDKPNPHLKSNVGDKSLPLNKKLIRQNIDITNVKSLRKTNNFIELKVVAEPEEKGIVLED